MTDISIQTTGVNDERSLEVNRKLREWKTSCTPERGFEWGIKNWRTDRYRLLLSEVCVRYITGLASLNEVHKAFVFYARAHRRTGVVGQLGAQTNTCTPQVEPSSESLQNILKVMGVNEDEYTCSKSIN